MNLNSIMIGSDNPKRLSDYYAKVFGPPTWEQDGFSGWQIGSGMLSITSHDQVKGKNAHPGRILWNIETPNVEGEFKKLKDAGATVIQEPYHPQGADEMWVCTFADPDDNYFQLVSPM